MMRGLFSPWKQPIYADFDINMTLELLDEAINRAWEAGYECVACVSDCAGANQAIWSNINIDENRTFLLHPATGRKIYLFADAPHTLKLIRNWMVDNGFLLDDGFFIPPVDSEKKHPLWKLVARNTTEISDTFFLREEHITLQGSQRQNVSWAAKILSRKCAVALQRKVGTLLAKKLAEFILTVNDWFDVFNSRSLNVSQTLKKPYGHTLVEQNDALDKMFTLMSTMIPGRKNKMQVIDFLLNELHIFYIFQSCRYFKERY